MASFTFAAGNAAGVRRLPLYVLGGLATLVVPRTERIWVFGSGIGPGEGALALLRVAGRELDPATRLIWLASTPAELARARELGLDAVAKTTVRGLWLTMRAAVAVVTHGLGDVNRFGVRGAFVVQLWHGIPLKRLHLDAPVALSADGRMRRAVVAFGYRAVGRQISLFPVSSQRVVPRVVSAFAVDPARVAVTGDPRDDVLLTGDPRERRAIARALLETVLGPLPAAGPVVMYAPTWRDGGLDPAAPDEQTWHEIVAWLDRVDGVLLMRSHHLGLGDYAGGPARSPRVRLLDGAMLADITPALPGVDHLITDYSSTAFDFSLVGGTTVFLAVDIETYLASRGLYEAYATITGGQYVVSWAHALALLDQRVHGDPSSAEASRVHQRWLRDEHFDHLDGRAGERVLAEIRRRLEPARASGESAPGQVAQTPLVTAPPRPRLVEVRIEADRLRLLIDTGDAVVSEARLAGPRDSVPATLRPTDRPGQVAAEFALVITRWGDPGLALPSGDYHLLMGRGPGEPPTTRIERGHDRPDVVHPLFRASVHSEGGGFVLRIGAPLAEDERGRPAQRALRRDYLRRRGPLEDAVYFESFYGRSASDNPLGIDRALARLHPEIRRYWSVADRSIPVPAGAVPIVEYSRQWWQVRAGVRVYVINDWLRWTYRKRRGQHVLQTWHGTMLKRLALDRPERTPRRNFAVVRQSWRWNALLAQNAYSAQRLRTSYAFRGPIWQLGYPRNDGLADTARAAAVRALIAVPTDHRVVLYAPTWRDDRAAIVDYLDLDRFAADLPAQSVLLVRGHSRTLAHGAERRSVRIVDVTSYPDIADLLLIADVLVTDYSSVMFDFAATGKPIVLYTPDLAHYDSVLRGFYFDLLADAPGPVAHTHTQLAAAMASIGIAGTAATTGTSAAARIPPEYAEAYAAWRARFTPREDGHAGERVVQRLFDEGWLG